MAFPRLPPNILQIASLLIALAAVFGSINYFLLKLPSVIGILVVAMLASMSALGLYPIVPSPSLAEDAREYVEKFWVLVDEILNAVLFMLIGVEIFAVELESGVWVTGVNCIGLALAGRLAAVVVPILMLRPLLTFAPGVMPIKSLKGAFQSRWPCPYRTANGNPCF